MLSDIATRFAQSQHISEITHKQAIDYTRLAVKKKYITAYNTIMRRRVADEEFGANIRAFVKSEKMPLEKLEGGKPRLIQFRSSMFTYMMKRFATLFSKSIVHNDNVFNHQPLNTIIMKSYSPIDRARILRESWDSYKNPVAVCLDHSKYDGSITKELLKIEHEFWRNILKDKASRRRFDVFLRRQLNNKCRTMGGLRYAIKGTRMSGEFTTSDGNCILNIIILTYICEASKFKSWKLHVDGDDSVLILESSELGKMIPLSELKQFNITTTCDRIADDFRRIDFCQCSPLRVDNRWIMIKKPMRTISRMSYCESKYLKCLKRYIASVGVCELSNNVGVPITQEWCKMQICMSDYGKPITVECPARFPGEEKYRQVDMQTRRDFEVAFGISVPLQLAIENEIMDSTELDYNKLNTYLARQTKFQDGQAKKFKF